VGTAASTTEVEEAIDGGPLGGALSEGLTASTTEDKEDIDPVGPSGVIGPGMALRG
jgi:hypothetical protein